MVLDELGWSESEPLVQAHVLEAFCRAFASGVCEIMQIVPLTSFEDLEEAERAVAGVLDVVAWEMCELPCV